MKLDPLVKEKYPELTIGYAIARNVKVERTVNELEEEKQRVISEVRDKYALTPAPEIPEVKAYRRIL